MVALPLFPTESASAVGCKPDNNSRTATIKPEDGEGLTLRSTVYFARCAKTDVIYSMKLEWSGNHNRKCSNGDTIIQSVKMDAGSIAGHNYSPVTWKCANPTYDSKLYNFADKVYPKGAGDRCFKVAVHVAFRFSGDVNRTIPANCAR